MPKASNRSNYSDYNFIRTITLTPVEKSVMSYVLTYSDYCSDSSEKIGRSMGRSAKTIRRAVHSLRAKGILIVKYTFFKKFHMKLASLEEQRKILASKGMLIVSNISKYLRRKSSKSLKNHPDRTSVSSHDRTSVSYLNKKETKEIKQSNIDEKNAAFSLKPKQSFDELRQIALSKALSLGL